ncbi:hypothetical protein [Massilia soli]|uniref:Uncharacterized protein n=1 Tax=Massilia soli TaxID=2792854 RepID=A0ABS7SN57_9BURK|nr:hypothetical protein [Massilia soli]MBZ2207122.1 hypothetical protein [Massilia soli]
MLGEWVTQAGTPHPCCVAFEEDGKGQITIAGTAQDGVLMGLPIDPIPN